MAAADGRFLSGGGTTTPSPARRLQSQTELDSTGERIRYENMCDRQPYDTPSRAPSPANIGNGAHSKRPVFRSPTTPHDAGVAAASQAPSKYDNVYHQYFIWNSQSFGGTFNLEKENLKRGEVFHWGCHACLISLRMRRYFNKRSKDGNVAASQEALKLWQSDEGRVSDEHIFSAQQVI